MSEINIFIVRIQQKFKTDYRLLTSYNYEKKLPEQCATGLFGKELRLFYVLNTCNNTMIFARNMQNGKVDHSHMDTFVIGKLI